MGHAPPCSTTIGGFPYRCRSRFMALSTIGRRISHRSRRRLPGKCSSITPSTTVTIPGPRIPGNAMMPPRTTSRTPQRFLRSRPVQRSNGDNDPIPRHRRQAAGLLGQATGARLAENREGIDREPRVLPCHLIHGSLTRAVRAAHGHVPLTGRRGQGRADPVCQRAPESRTDLACQGPLSGKVLGFDMFARFNESRGVNHCRHGVPPPITETLSSGYCSLRRALRDSLPTTFHTRPCSHGPHIPFAVLSLYSPRRRSPFCRPIPCLQRIRSCHYL